uniref:mannosyl-oligosaccharide glucosidase n=1 Tax=Syphacia muris TaxID=451379 RepID=A0A0N5ASX6_9BILA
ICRWLLISFVNNDIALRFVYLHWFILKRIWGSYRSHMYFGLRTQHPQSPLFGMIWYPQKGMQLTIHDVRHWCEKVVYNYRLYIYTHADGRTFGNQIIEDNLLNIRTSWLNNGSSWTSQITTTSGYSEMHEKMGMFALSNMLGTIGYNFGHNRVRGEPGSYETLYGPNQLLSACPCRSTFPRGFLWDEGFHSLLIRKFDAELALKITGSWLNTMNIDGWIPREMILGAEAELRVPPEFIVQTYKTANPPISLQFVGLDTVGVLRRMYPRLSAWYNWLNNTQAGYFSGTYRWRGRNATTERELNPKTFASGFDDYPRATHPSEHEYHLDLRCWMAFSASVLSKLGEIVGDTTGKAIYERDSKYLSDFDNLNKLHWSRRKKRFCLLFFGVNEVFFALICIVRNGIGQLTLQLVEDAFGYISLFPMILRLLPYDSVQLELILSSMHSEEELWTPFGIRSLSKSSPYYRQWNTKDDPPYWRGDIWMNMNYMVLSALKYYSQFSGPNKELALRIYNDLRNNVVKNVFREFNRTGTFWEHYDDKTGRGGGAYPFTGWTSLVLAIMAEQYD